MDLRVKLLGSSPWFERILRQEGVPFEIVDEKHHDSLNFDIVAKWAGDIRLTPSRLTITDHRALSRAIGQSARSVLAHDFVSSNRRGHAFLRIFSANLGSRRDYREIGYHRDRSGRRIPLSGIILMEMEGRQFLSLPWKMKKFPTHWTGWTFYLRRSNRTEVFFCEAAPLVDDRLVREAVFQALLLGYQSINAPVVRVSAKIAGPGYVAIRIDADGFSTKSTQQVRDTAKRNDVAFSWFIDTWSWREQRGEIKELSLSNEIGLHSYYHATSVWELSNLRNIRKGLRMLQDLGISRNGFVSPYGHWNNGLASAIAAEGLAYSSEFGCSCDIFPSVHSLKGSNSLMQIPTIPISLGVWTGQRDYWEVLGEEIDNRIDESGFAVMYDHPLDRLEHQVQKLDSLISRFSLSGYRVITMGQLSSLLASRQSLAHAELCDGRVKYTTEGSDAGNFVVEELWGQSYLLDSEEHPRTSGLDSESYFSIDWGKTIFFGLLATVPIGFHTAWAKLRGFRWNRIRKDLQKVA